MNSELIYVNHKSRNLIAKDVMNNSFEQLQAAEQALYKFFCN